MIVKIRKAKGFTLIELMIVVAIIGILAAIAIPKFADLIRKSNEGATKGNLGSLRSSLSIYFADIEGFYPVGLDADDNALTTNLVPKYIKAIPACYAAGWHPKLALEENQDYTDPTIAKDSGRWGYDGANAADFQTASGQVPMRDAWGTLWVACSHTDTKSVTWSSY